MNQSKITFNSHKNHNPSCDILCYQVDADTTVTYGVYVEDTKSSNLDENGNNRTYIKGTEFMEVYIGENYNVNSSKRSYSRVYYAGITDMPKKNYGYWLELKQMYKDKYKS